MFDMSTLRFLLIFNWLWWLVSSIIFAVTGNEKWFSRAALAAICLCGFAIFEAITNQKEPPK